MLPEVEEFLKVKKEADREYNEWQRDATRDEPRRGYGWGMGYDNPEYIAWRDKRAAWQEKYDAEYRKHHDKHRARLRAARTKLRETTKDPIVRWMMDNIQDYWSYIETVLPELPATREQLEDLATQHDWCSEFDGFMEQATEAGVIPPRDEKFDASELVEWVSNEYDVYEREVRREIQSRVNKIVERALAIQHNEKATA